jgi:hypothetical protein
MIIIIKMERNRILVNQTNKNDDDDCGDGNHKSAKQHRNMVDCWPGIEEWNTFNL